MKVEADGTLTGLTKDGKKLIKLLHLNEGNALTTRRKYLKRAAACTKHAGNAEIEQLFREDFGFPDELPDLRPSQPGSNTVIGSEETCYLALREKGQLPPVYDLP